MILLSYSAQAGSALQKLVAGYLATLAFKCQGNHPPRPEAQVSSNTLNHFSL